MNLSANYNVGLRQLFGPSAPKRLVLGTPSAFALANLFKLASSLHAALGLKNLLESLRGCLQNKASSLFGIILANFRSKSQGLYTQVDITPAIWTQKVAQQNPKNHRSLLYRHTLNPLHCG